MSLQLTLTTQQQQIQMQIQHHQQLQQSSMHSFHHLSSDILLKHNGGLVTPPSPRFQSPDSGRYRRRGRRSSGSRGGSSSGERAATESVVKSSDEYLTRMRTKPSLVRTSKERRRLLIETTTWIWMKQEAWWIRRVVRTEKAKIEEDADPCASISVDLILIL